MELWVKSGRKSHLYRGEAPNVGTNWLARPVPDPDFLQQQMRLSQVCPLHRAEEGHPASVPPADPTATVVLRAFLGMNSGLSLPRLPHSPSRKTRV